MTDNKQKPRKTSIASDTWTVRGVSAETRSAVKKAARRSGMTVGAWLDQEMRLAASQKLTEAVPVVQEGQDTSEAMKAILERLERLENRSAGQPPASWWRRWLGVPSNK